MAHNRFGVRRLDAALPNCQAATDCCHNHHACADYLADQLKVGRGSPWERHALNATCSRYEWRNCETRQSGQLRRVATQWRSQGLQLYPMQFEKQIALMRVAESGGKPRALQSMIALARKHAGRLLRHMVLHG